MKESVFGAGLLGQPLGVLDQGLGLLLGEVHEVAAADLEDVVDEAFEGRPLVMGRWPLKMTRSKQESTATIKLVNLVTKRDSVFMAFSFGLGPQETPF